MALAEELRHAERRAATFRVAWAIGHLIGTPLNVIAGRAALIRSSTDAGASAEHARRIEEQVERLAQEVRRLIDYLTPPEPTSEPGPLAGVIDAALVLSQPITTERGVHLELPPGELPKVLVDRMSTLLVVTTLLSLAARNSPRESKFRLRITEPASGADTILLEITVSGMKYPEGRIDRLEPPESAAPGTSDTMQALSICFGVAQRRGGVVRVGRDEADATVLSFTCPVVA